MKTVQELLDHFRRQRAWTRSLVAAIPEERFDWAPAPSDFTCGGLVRHLMQAEIFWSKLVTRGARGEVYDPFGLPGSGQERMTAFRSRNVSASGDSRMGSSFAECLRRWREIQARTEEELGRLSQQDLSVSMTHPLTGLAAPVWEMLLVMIEHEAHHRGQLSAYLKVLELPQPPVFGMP